MPVLIEARLGNETGEITCVNALVGVAHLASSGPSTMLNTNNRKEDLRCNNALLCLVSLTSISWTDWRRSDYRWQLPAYCCINSHRKLRRVTLARIVLSALGGVFCPSSTSSFPEDCARLKLSSTRASQAGLREMMMQMKNERSSSE